MYFVTINRKGYVLFCTTPSERAAVGLTEQQIVHFLVRSSVSDQWTVVREWSAKDYSQTDFFAALHSIDEPEDPRRLLDFLPQTLRR